VPLGSNIVNIAGSEGDVGQGYAIKSDGSLWQWFWNIQGQIESFNQITGINNVANVANKFAHSLAIKNDGTIFGWGNNDHGEVGAGIVGNGTDINLPVISPTPALIVCSVLNNVEDLIGKTVSVYPNPANEQLFIELTDYKNTTAEIFNLQGKLLHSVILQSSKNSIQINGLQSGLYVVRVKTPDGIIVKSLVKI
jgi:hypothetical protein